jgi:predicted RNase H-like nuclease (RuvC/YqgF family)
MTDEEKRIIKNFEANVRQLLRLYAVLQKENQDLYSELEQKEHEIEKLHAEIGQCKRDYSNLKLAKMIEVSDSEMKNAKQRLSKLVRDVNKCIGLLSTEQATE